MKWPKPSNVLKTVGIIAAVVALALLVAQDQETLRIRSALGAEDPAFPDYASMLTGAHLTAGDRYTVLTNGVRIFPAMLDAIRAAKRRICLETYVYDRGEVADAFTTALADAASRGVTVRILIDALGASTMPEDAWERLKRAGAEIATFNALHWYSVEEVNYRTHRKILVVDGEVAFTGGAGFADQWRGNATRPGEWRDTHLRVTGPAAAHLEGAFYENWLESGTVTTPVLDLSPPLPGTAARSMIIWSSPTGGSNGVKLLYLLSAAAARRTLDIQTPYFVLDESTRWSLLDARRRGVRVRLLLDGDLTDARTVKYASRNDYDALLAAGVEIHEYQPTMMHVKAMVVDGVWSLVGSANFDNRSFELNDEVVVAVADEGLASALLADVEADLRHTRRIELAGWRARPLQDKARERLWGLLSELF